MPNAEQRQELEARLRAGGWPDADLGIEEANRAPLVSKRRVQAFAPGEHRVALYPPPLTTVADDLARNAEFWNEHGALDQIDPAEAVMLGDFGSGSDAVLIADFTTGSPRVLRLQWSEEGNRWTLVAHTVDELLLLLDLDANND